VATGNRICGGQLWQFDGKSDGFVGITDQEEHLKRVHIVGRKNSGKTTLIIELIEYLKGLGYRVGTVKHTSHRHELDTPGKDSHRHRQAGAVAVGIISPNLHAVFLPTDPATPPPDPYERLAPCFEDCDLVLVEGDSQTTAPKVEVWRSACDTAPLAVSDSSIRALITNDPVEVSVPVWPRNDLTELAKRFCI
jgi:molybdopterin-guanine dinucleotide biosynthesis adapter protein